MVWGQLEVKQKIFENRKDSIKKYKKKDISLEKNIIIDDLD